MGKRATAEEIVDDATAYLIKTSSIERTERWVSDIYEEPEDSIQDIVAEALTRILVGAPAELRPSFTSVCSYHRWNALYMRAYEIGDADVAMKCQQNIDALMKSVH